MKTNVIVQGVLVACAASAGWAGQIAISDIGGGIVLNSGPVGAGVFGNGQTNWSAASLANVNLTLNAGGIATNGRITVLAADTDHGMALMALIDQQLVEGASSTGTVHMDSVAQGANTAFIACPPLAVIVNLNNANARIASGNFVWNSNGGGNGFAWANQVAGDATTFRFNKVANAPLGLNEASTFQFVTYNGAAWNVIPVAANLTTFSATDAYGFSAVALIVPAPSMVALAGPVGLLAVIRRRRAR